MLLRSDRSERPEGSSIMKELKMIPFGAQYYRAPTPTKDVWRKDPERFKEQGLNTVKIWVQWRSNMPAPDTYDFSDTDELMNICGEPGIYAVLNFGTLLQVKKCT